MDSERSDEDGDDSDNDGLEFDVDKFQSPTSTTVVPSNTTPGEVHFDEPSPIEADDSLGRFRDGMLVCSAQLNA